MGTWKKVGLGIFVVGVSFEILSSLASYPETISWYKYLDLRIFVVAVLAQTLYVRLIRPRLLKLHDYMKWSPMKLFGVEPTNVNLIGFTIPIVGPAFGILILSALPLIIFVEEWLFRFGTSDWAMAWSRSVLFGAFHVLAGLAVADGITITALGLILSGLYFVGGLHLSWLGHLEFNLVGLMVLIYISSRESIYWIKQRLAS